MKPWRIDSLDAVAGLCFAVSRDPDLGGNPDLDTPAVYIAAPLFRPEILASRNIAFAAARGPFQLGLFLDREEVSFPTLESLTEFVRRCYLSGGHTDGGGGRGPLPTPPVPDGGEPEGGLSESEITEEDGSVAAVMEAGADFAKVASNTSAEPVRINYTSSTLKPLPTSHERASIADAAASLILELLRRMPGTRPASNWFAWADSAARLGAAIDGLGLWHTILNGSIRTTFLERSERAAQSIGLDVPHPWPSAPHSRAIYFLVRFLRAPHFLAPWWGYDCWPHEWWPPRQALTDPMDDLSTWPMGRELALPNVRTVYDQLCAVSGKPDVLLRLPRRAAAIAVLASAHVLRRPLPYGLFAGDDSQLQIAQHEHFRRAAQWLIAQFPKYAYRPEIEKMIEAVGVENSGGGPDGNLAAA